MAECRKGCRRIRPVRSRPKAQAKSLLDRTINPLTEFEYMRGLAGHTAHVIVIRIQYTLCGGAYIRLESIADMSAQISCELDCPLSPHQNAWPAVSAE